MLTLGEANDANFDGNLERLPLQQCMVWVGNVIDASFFEGVTRLLLPSLKLT